MTLSVPERLMLLNVIPNEGNITDLRIIRDLRTALSFSEEEHAAFKFQESENQVKWDVAAADAIPPKEIEIGPKASSIIVQAIEGVPKLPMSFLPLYERFKPTE